LKWLRLNRVKLTLSFGALGEYYKINYYENIFKKENSKILKHKVIDLEFSQK